MPEASDKAITVDQLRGFKQLRRVAELLSFLHRNGCDRDKAGNRELHFDDFVLLNLLYLFNPLIDSMRALQKVSDLPEVQARLGIKRFSLGSFSESCRVFDPSLLQGVVDQLAKGLLPVGREALLKDLPGKLTLVDSTVIQTLCTVAEAMFLPLGDGRHSHAWRLHLQFDVDHHVPGAWEITAPRNTGRSDEKNVLRRRLSPGHTYVMDRWYAQFTLWNDIKAAGSSYVCRVRDNSVYEVIENRPLDERAIEAGVISDQIVTIGLSKKPEERADHPTRLICVACTPHQKRGKGKRRGAGQTGPTSDGVLRIVTDLPDVPAHIIAFLYQYRWTIEIFFRFLKQILACRHLLSTRIEGIRIQIYAAVICCLMLNTLTGSKPSKWMVTLMSLYLQGLASEEDVLRELNRPDKTGIKLKAKEELWKKLGY
ncbi:MAG TPA: IS4 family transposase [Tepidisphaeraceae bacterium]|nr:IS4 family transposase [Tepidisphaeraceae bacterium]